MSINPALRRRQKPISSSDVEQERGQAAFRSLGLTSREAEVLHWITEGKRDREIACIIGVSVRTAQNHVANILHKFSVETRTAAARVALDRLMTVSQ